MSGGAAVLLVIVLLAGYALGGAGDCRDFSQGQVLTSKTTLRVNVAQTQIDQIRGLAGCKKLPDKTGMYFPYSSQQIPTYWMKGMLMPIDIIWITDNTITGLQEFVPVPQGKLDEELLRYKPDQPVNAVLEVAAGKAKLYGLSVGSKIQFQE